MRDVAGRLAGAIDTVVAGKHEVAEIAVASVLSGGHLLIEDVPGVGKTLLAQVIARAIGRHVPHGSRARPICCPAT